MAAGQHNLSRRAVLGGAAGVPLLPKEGAPPPGFTRFSSPAKAGEDWAAAVAAVRAAEARLARVEAASAGYRFDEEEAVLPAYGGLRCGFGGGAGGDGSGGAGLGGVWGQAGAAARPRDRAAFGRRRGGGGAAGRYAAVGGVKAVTGANPVTLVLSAGR